MGKGGVEVGGGGGMRLYTYHYTITTRMTPALRWAELRAILMCHNCEGQNLTARPDRLTGWAAMRAVSFEVSRTVRDKVRRQCPQTTSFEEKGEPKKNRTEILQLTSLKPYHTGSLQHSLLLLPWCFTSTETIRLIGDGTIASSWSPFSFFFVTSPVFAMQGKQFTVTGASDL